MMARRGSAMKNEKSSLRSKPGRRARLRWYLAEQLAQVCLGNSEASLDETIAARKKIARQHVHMGGPVRNYDTDRDHVLFKWPPAALHSPGGNLGDHDGGARTFFRLLRRHPRGRACKRR